MRWPRSPAPRSNGGATPTWLLADSGSGNAQRRRQHFLLFHGSFLLHLDLSLVEQALPLPSRQPDYRVNRSHADFLINLNVQPHTIKAALIKAWDAQGVLDPIPFGQITLLARERYALDEWNLKF